MGAVPGPGEVVRRAAADHGEAMVDPRAEDRLQIQLLGLAIDEREHDHAERVTELRLLEEGGEYLLGLRVALELDHEPDPVAVGLVAQVGDRVGPPGAHDLRDLLDDARLVHLIGKFRDDQRTLPESALLEMDFGAHVESSSPGPVGGLDAGPAVDVPARREVRPGQAGEQLVAVALRVRDEVVDRGEELPGVVRREPPVRSGARRSWAARRRCRALCRRGDPSRPASSALPCSGRRRRNRHRSNRNSPGRR